MVEIRGFNLLINSNLFFHEPVKNKQKTYEKLVEMSRNDDYTTGNLLDYLHHEKYKLISIDLSRKTNPRILLQINFAEKLQQNDSSALFFIAENQQKLF